MIFFHLIFKTLVDVLLSPHSVAFLIISFLYADLGHLFLGFPILEIHVFIFSSKKNSSAAAGTASQTWCNNRDLTNQSVDWLLEQYHV